MNENYIRKLIRLVEESDIESLEVHSWGRKVKIIHRSSASSNGQGAEIVAVAAAPARAHVTSSAPVASAPAAEAAGTSPAQVSAEESRYVPVKSPMVGTFYAAPAPDADPYVTVNQKIRVGQVVCIVEAMKLMNEIESEVGGRIAKVLVQNAEPVEFGQVLFLIEPD